MLNALYEFPSKAPDGVWREGCLVQTCKAGTVVKSLAEECLKLIEKHVENVLNEKKDELGEDSAEKGVHYLIISFGVTPFN